MPKVVIGIIIFAVLMLIGSCGSSDVTTYYLDDNGNGECDYGEAVWDEDADGNMLHWFG